LHSCSGKILATLSALTQARCDNQKYHANLRLSTYEINLARLYMTIKGNRKRIS